MYQLLQELIPKVQLTCAKCAQSLKVGELYKIMPMYNKEPSRPALCHGIKCTRCNNHLFEIAMPPSIPQFKYVCKICKFWSFCLKGNYYCPNCGHSMEKIIDSDKTAEMIIKHLKDENVMNTLKEFIEKIPEVKTPQDKIMIALAHTQKVVNEALDLISEELRKL